MIEWMAGIVVLPVGWLVNRQLEINRTTLETSQELKGLKSDVEHTRGRVDAIYEHLIVGKGPRQGRG